eukprot:TRINITY_DN16922_c0_g1_i1.p2 TRINITY_DN16922_c0_g1~~TRINITY_DN16922_c0_g1_i1.p2  ORF type:complete len:179 (+),score=50.32 TRINITY_DN16922_c0_g1_i1:49-585(+)
MLLALLLREISEMCPAYCPFFGAMGVTASLVFTVVGAAYGTAKSAVGISSMGVMKPELVMKAIIPVIFAGVIGIYGLIVCVIVLGNINPDKNYTMFRSFLDLGSGLTVGLSGMAAGMAIGIVGDSGVRATAQQPRLYIAMVLILIFSEALALYGLIVAILLSGKSDSLCQPDPVVASR